MKTGYTEYNLEQYGDQLNQKRLARSEGVGQIKTTKILEIFLARLKTEKPFEAPLEPPYYDKHGKDKIIDYKWVDDGEVKKLYGNKFLDETMEMAEGRIKMFQKPSELAKLMTSEIANQKQQPIKGI